MKRYTFFLNTKMIVAVSIGAVIYGITSLAAVPIGLNTQIRPSIVILTLFSIYFGPVTGFFVGLLGHILADMLINWGIWWSWAFSSGIFGFTTGLVFLFPGFDIRCGLYTKFHIIFLVFAGIVGLFLGYSISGVTDVIFMGEPPNKIMFQTVVIFIVNCLLFIFFSIPITMSFLSANRKHSNLEIEN